MYFFNLEAAKRELLEGPLPADRILPYVIGFCLSISLSMEAMRWSGTAAVLPSGWSWLPLTSELLLTLLGTCYLYHCNGGAMGPRFLERWLVLGWVMAFRVLAAFILLLVPLFMLAGATKLPWWSDLVGMVVLSGVLYWRIGAAFRDLRNLEQAVPYRPGELPPLPS